MHTCKTVAMNTTSSRPAAHTATIADEVIAGRAFPATDWIVKYDHAAVVELIVDRRNFWLEVAGQYLRMAEAGCPESARDAAEAMLNHDALLPKVAA